MDFLTVSTLEKRKRADILVLPFWKGKNAAEPASSFEKLKQFVEGPLKTKDFKGKEGEVLILYGDKQQEPRIALLGLGEQKKISVEILRRAYANVVKACHQLKIKTVNVLFPTLQKLDVIRGISEGLLLANYAYEKLKKETIKEKSTVLVQKAYLIGAGKKENASAKKYAAICEGVCLARDLVNGNADDITPQTLVKTAQNLAKKFPHVKTIAFNKKRLEKEGFGLLIAVNRGSNREPSLITVAYRGNPKSKDCTVIVGKGVTYDTGGLNLKPTGYMETMKSDMSGAATALGTIYAAASIRLKCNVTAVIPTTENSIGSHSYKPGDVYISYAGKTVEIGNTDAEGRLILADALAYASRKLKPTRIIDFATLTGAMVIALGEETTGFMSNDDKLAKAMIHAGEETFERVWRLPIFEEYKKQLKSDIADIKNIGGRSAGSITAALFLQEFVGDLPWAHCDIAGTAYLTKARRYHPKNGTGVGIRLMIEFLENLT